MANAWDLEYTLEADQALALIADQFPALNPQTIKPFGFGWDNTAYIINDRYVFRFPRRQVAIQALAHETYILPKIAAHLSIPVPVPLWFGKPSVHYPHAFIGYHILSGKTADTQDLSDEQRTRLAPVLGNFLKQLHSLPVLDEYRHMLPGIELARMKLEKNNLISYIKNNMQQLQALGLLTHQDQFERALAAASALRQPESRTVVHSDIYARHLLVDEHQQLAGVIDWGEVHIGDSANDIGIAHSFLPPAAHAAFRAAYGPISEDTWHLAQLQAINCSMTLVVYGSTIGDAHLERAGKRALNYIVQQL